MQALLHAGFVSVDEADDALIVGFADRQFETSRYFMLQRASSPHADAGIYLEHNSQAASAYGTVSRCSLSEGCLEITVDEATARQLGTETTFAITFPVDQVISQRLRMALERILAGTGCRVASNP